MNDRNNISLGDFVRDALTGFEGTVTGIADYLTGCSQASVQPGVVKDGALSSAVWFDVDRLQVIEKQRFKNVVRTSAGGPYGGAPTK